MSSNWPPDLSSVKVKRNLIRERLEQKKKERLDNSSGNLNILDPIKTETEDSKLGLNLKQEPGKCPILLSSYHRILISTHAFSSRYRRVTSIVSL